MKKSSQFNAAHINIYAHIVRMISGEDVRGLDRNDFALNHVFRQFVFRQFGPKLLLLLLFIPST